MALITATTALELDPGGVDLGGYFAPGKQVSLHDNLNYVSPQGRTYQDVIDVVAPKDASWHDWWGGSGIVFNPTTHALTAGTFTGVVAVTMQGTIASQEFAIEGFSLDAVAFYQVTLTASTADDTALLESLFAGADTFNLSPFADSVSGLGGNDTLRGNGGNDTLSGDAGNDSIDGGTGSDRLHGGTGNDVFVVDGTGDLVFENVAAGVDTVRSTVTHTLATNVENLLLLGGAGIGGTGNASANSITGNGAANALGGGGANDTLRGAGGGDTLNGGAGNDSMVGGAGNDMLTGGAGNDTLTGGTGLDAFRFVATPGAANADRLTGFSSADDRIDLDNAVMPALGAVGALPAAMFRLGAAAADPTDRIVYNQTTGALLYDADGNGSGSAQLIATLNAGSPLVLADLFVI